MSAPDNIIDLHRKFEDSMARMQALQDAQNELRSEARQCADTNPFVPGLLHAISRLDHLIRKRLDSQARILDQMHWAEGEVRA